TPDTPAAGGPLDRLAGNRKTAAALLFALAVVWAVPAVVAGVRFARAVAANQAADAAKPEADKDPAAAKLDARPTRTAAATWSPASS
ncbi:hypothetical protein, partial [Salmonella enterica]|uniref:hypothetical protein n=1 Tax=Salmonella enterica TaxID=28901 RepID=UPI003D2CC626